MMYNLLLDRAIYLFSLAVINFTIFIIIQKDLPLYIGLIVYSYHTC